MKRLSKLHQIQSMFVALFVLACNAHAQSATSTSLRVTDSRFAPADEESFSQPRRLAWSDDGRKLAIVAQHITPLSDGSWEIDFEVQIWDLSRRKKIRSLRTQPFHGMEATNLAWSPTGQTLAVVYVLHPVTTTVFWNVKSGQTRRQWLKDYGKEAVDTSFLTGAPHGGWLRSGTECRLLRYTEGHTEKPQDWCILDRYYSAQGKVGQSVLTERADSGVFAAAAISRNGQLIAVVPSASESSESTLHIFDAAHNTLIKRTLEPFPSNYQMHFAMSDDGTTLALLSGRSSVEIRFCTNGIKRQKLKTKHLLSKFALSPDGKQLAIHDQAGSVTLWDSASGRYLRYLGHVKVRYRIGLGLRVLGGNADDVGALGRIAFSPDGNSLAVAGDDGLVKIFDITKTITPNQTRVALTKAKGATWSFHLKAKE